MARFIVDRKPLIAIQPADLTNLDMIQRCQSCDGELVQVSDRVISHSTIRTIKQKILACVDCKVTYTDIS